MNIEEVYERFADEVKKNISFDRIAIAIINPEDHTATTTYISGTNMAARKKGEGYPLAGSITEETRRTRVSLLLQPKDSKETQEAMDKYPSFLGNLQAGLRSIMSVPLISKNEVIGVLHLQSPKPNAYSENDLRFCERVAIQISGAIANAQLFKQVNRMMERLRESEERYRNILANIEDGYYEVDIAGNFTFFNDSFWRIMGYPKKN